MDMIDDRIVVKYVTYSTYDMPTERNIAGANDDFSTNGEVPEVQLKTHFFV